MYRFFVDIENVDERKDPERCQAIQYMGSKKDADLFLKAFVFGLIYQNESLRAKYYGWEIWTQD